MIHLMLCKRCNISIRR